MIRRFELHRDTDVSGVSGTGVIADGELHDDVWEVRLPPDGPDVLRRSVWYPPGWVLLRWRGDYPSLVFWPSLDDAMAVHGHDGATRVVWLD